MSAPVDPAMQAWIDRQMAKFKPSDLDPAVALIRGWERADREKAARDRKRQGSAA
ncbi:hypothetical protein [Nocardia sp. NPDC051463]|uniref:hypothetical protein n=1 Tax=Nocardia sp. NPDC051463 TaxID=3154845 RepID=UPI00344F1DDD